VEKLVEFITFIIRMLIGWIPMLFIFVSPILPFTIIISLIQGYHDIWTTIIGVACAFVLYCICSPYKRLVDYTTDVSGKIFNWIGGE